MTPVSGYIICATPRSGSTLLCDLLTDTGVAGAPNSFYRQLSMSYWVETWGVSEPQDSPGFDRVYLNAALQVGRADTDMFGMRLMWNGVSDLSDRLSGLFPGPDDDARRFAAAFSNPAYIYLLRRDLVSQAVSRYRAETGGLWHVNADGSERERINSAPVPYDADAITTYLTEAETDNRQWEAWFSQNRITPFRLTYEELSAQPRDGLADVLAVLGLDPVLAKRVAPRTLKLADAQSLEWVARLTDEMT